MSRRTIFSVLAGIYVTGALFACSPEPPPTYTFHYTEKRTSLENGLRVVVIPDKTTQLVQVDVRYEVGSNENPAGKAGLAHLVEHMMFQHRPLGPDKPATFDLLPQLVVSFNAYTTWDKTHYWLRGRTEDLDAMLRLEAYRMAQGCKGIPEGQFQREREVVRNEIRQRTGQPEGLIPQILLSSVYPKGHPYEQMVGGNDKQLTNIRMQDVCAFLSSYYLPPRATIIVTGNVDPIKVAQKIRFNFGKIPRGKPAARVKAPLVHTAKYTKIERELDVERSSVHIIWPVTSQFGDDSAAMRFMMFAMAGRVANFGDKYDFAVSVQPGMFGGALAPVYMLSIELKSYSKVAEALEFVWKAARSAHRGMESGIFDDDVKQRVKAQFIEGLEPLAARPELVANLIQFRGKDTFGTDNVFVIDELNRIDKLDGGAVGSYIKRMLKKSHATVVVIKAKEGAKRGDRRSGLKFSTKGHDKQPEPAVSASEAYRSMKVPSTKSSLSKAEHHVLGNGMRVVLLPSASMPIVDVRLIFDAGSAHEPENKAGLANIAAGMLRPPGRSNAEAKTGISIRGSAGYDYTTFGARGMAIYLNVMLKALERRIKVGDYNQDSIESRSKSWKISNKSKRTRQRRAFQMELYGALYGPKHPYTLKGSLTAKSAGKIGRDNAMSFKGKHFTASNATIVIAGDFDAVKALKKIKSVFGGWSKGHKDSPVLTPAAARQGAMFVGVQGEPTPQLRVIIGYPGQPGIDKQQAARLVAIGMLNLRMAAVRTELGSSYGTYARFETHRGPGAYTMGGSVDGQRAGEALAAMRKGVDTLRAGQDFNKQFVVARRIVVKRLLGQSTETYALARRLSQIANYSLPYDYYDTLVQQVAKVKPGEVIALLKKELAPEREVVMLLGARADLEKAFIDAGINNVKYIEPQ